MSYWSDRQKKLNKALEKDEEKLKKRLSRMYDDEARRLERQIAEYYEMYGEDNVIAYRKLLKELSPEDKRLLIEQMDEFAEKYPEYKDLMPVRASIYKLDRLEGLQYSIKMQQLRIGAKEQELIRDHLIKNAYRGANAAAEAMGFGSAFYSMNRNIMERFVGVPWADGKSFSDRIWENKEKLTNYLNKDLAQGFARGDSYANLTKSIMERMGNVSRRDAYRLVYTEGTHVMAESSMMPFEEDFEYYKLSTVGDSRVCSICRGLENGEPIPISKRVPGENFPPLHPWCRCTFTIEVEDWDAWMDDYVARHSPGPFYGDDPEEMAKRMEQRLSDSPTGKEFKKGEPMTHDEADKGKVNPGIKGDVWGGFGSNCQSCVIAYDARRKGYDVYAKSHMLSGAADRLARNITEAWSGGRKFDIIHAADGKALASHYLAAKPGERFILGFGWKDANYGHVVSVERTDTGVRIYDPQHDKTYTLNDLGGIDYSKSIATMRVDDIDLDMDVAGKVLNEYEND